MKRIGPPATPFVKLRAWRFRRWVSELAKEPPFRIFIRKVITVAPVSIRRKGNWDAISRPSYLVGLIRAADQALSEKVPAISAIEFGVGMGDGLLILEEYAAAVEREMGVRIEVYGFDTGKGFPKMCGDYRDSPDTWEPGEFPMDEAALRQRLSSRTTLVIGNVAQTVPEFVRDARHAPVGFIACDLALYSSARDALQVLSLPGKRTLMRIPMYFNNIDWFEMHQFAGERLALAEFNTQKHHVRIDHWHGISSWRVFPEAAWLRRMFIAHDLEAISKAQ